MREKRRRNEERMSLRASEQCLPKGLPVYNNIHNGENREYGKEDR